MMRVDWNQRQNSLPKRDPYNGYKSIMKDHFFEGYIQYNAKDPHSKEDQ